MRISIVAHVNSKREKIEKDLFDTLHVYVNAPPLEGKAQKISGECYPIISK